MSGNKRIVVLGRNSSDVDGLTRILEGAGYIVTSTINDGVAIDMVGSSTYDAMLITRDVGGSRPAVCGDAVEEPGRRPAGAHGQQRAVGPHSTDPGIAFLIRRCEGPDVLQPLALNCYWYAGL